MGKLISTSEKELGAGVFKRTIFAPFAMEFILKKISFLHCFLGNSLFCSLFRNYLLKLLLIQ